MSNLSTYTGHAVDFLRTRQNLLTELVNGGDEAFKGLIVALISSGINAVDDIIGFADELGGPACGNRVHELIGEPEEDSNSEWPWIKFSERLEMLY